MIPGEFVSCTDLSVHCGYPAGYAIAERLLERQGWRYLIQLDGWASPQYIRDHYPTHTDTREPVTG
jgi:hypothetical protein